METEPNGWGRDVTTTAPARLVACAIGAPRGRPSPCRALPFPLKSETANKELCVISRLKIFRFRRMSDYSPYLCKRMFDLPLVSASSHRGAGGFFILNDYGEERKQNAQNVLTCGRV